VPDFFDIQVFLIVQEGKLLAVVVLSPFVLVSEEDDGLEYGLAGG
jgi:hypothetical protein